MNLKGIIAKRRNWILEIEKIIIHVKELNQKSKCTFAVKLAERASSYIQKNSVKSLVYEAIDAAWKWIHKDENAGEVLYNFLDNEENGFTLYQEIEEDEIEISAWDCIIDAIAYVSKAAYEKEGIEYLPEPIEIVDDNIFTHMIESLILCDSMESEYIKDVFYAVYSP